MRDELSARPSVSVFGCRFESLLARRVGPWVLDDLAGGGIHHCNVPKVRAKITSDNKYLPAPFLNRC